ncbi:MAG: helix-turn-helix transcriptional regulator [Treponema sp.]|nr:helix-turn-helix transcriptional regulator [Treponema sp.]
MREEREKLCILQIDMSFKAGPSQNHVNYIEIGKHSPTLYTLLKLCNALHNRMPGSVPRRVPKQSSLWYIIS